MNEPRKHLLDLGLSDSEVTVYLAMVAGARTAREIVKVTSLKRPTTYYALSCLEKRGLTSKTGLTGDKSFILEPVERLVTIAKEKALAVSKLTDQIEDMIPVLTGMHAQSVEKPAVSFYEGTDAVKSVVMEMLYCKGKTINSVVPKDNFFGQVGADFVEMFVTARIKRKITTKNLWEGAIAGDVWEQYYKGVSEIRILPAVMRGKFNTTTFLYDDKTMYVSAKKNSYCVVITSQEHKDTMQAWFDGLWIASTKYE